MSRAYKRKVAGWELRKTIGQEAFTGVRYNRYVASVKPVGGLYCALDFQPILGRYSNKPISWRCQALRPEFNELNLVEPAFSVSAPTLTQCVKDAQAEVERRQAIIRERNDSILEQMRAP